MTDHDAAAANGGRRPGGLRESAGWFAVMVPSFAVFWLLLSGHLEPLFLMLGGLSVGLVGWLSWRADLTRVGMTAGFMLRLPGYLLWLAKEVLVSSVAVARRVWSPRPALLPTVDATSMAGLSELAQVVYANSITLTPGTLSLDVGDDRIEVHSLNPVGVEQLHAGAMLRQVRRLEAQR